MILCTSTLGNFRLKLSGIYLLHLMFSSSQQWSHATGISCSLIEAVVRRCSVVFCKKSVLEICSKFTGEHPCQSVISIKLLCTFIEITLRHGFSPINFLGIFRTPFPKNTYRWLLLVQPCIKLFMGIFFSIEML